MRLFGFTLMTGGFYVTLDKLDGHWPWAALPCLLPVLIGAWFMHVAATSE